MPDTSTAAPPARALRGRLRAGEAPALRAPAALRWRRAPHALANAAELAIVALGYLALPLWPFVATAVARDLSYLRRYPATLRQVVRHIQGTLRGRSVARFLLQKMGQRRTQREQVVGACTHCGNCCLYRGCLFLSYDARGQSRCGIYGGRVWKMLACGDYPINGEEIELYECPSFVAVPASRGGRKVIPIAAIGFSPADAPRADPLPAAAVEVQPRRTRRAN
jgi:hypothetical protein